MSLYREYIKEREKKEIIESNDAFITFKILNEICYIVDIYVRPDKRKSGVAKELADRVCVVAVENGCKHLLGSVDVNADGATDSLKVLLAYGMDLDSISGSLIFFKKGLGE